MKVALIRQDKIGDLIATLPTDQLIDQFTDQLIDQFTDQLVDQFTDQLDVQKTNPLGEITWFVNESLIPLMEMAEPQRSFLTLGPQFSWKALKILVQQLRELRPDLVVIFYAQWWVYLACFLARIPIRFGRYSQWYSYLFLNKGLRQSRSKSEKHEFEYNQDLLKAALGEHRSLSGGKSLEKSPTLKLKPPLLRHLFEKFQIAPQKYYVIHPGMAGSALNWPTERYSELIASLTKDSIVVITGTHLDKLYLDPLRDKWEQHSQVRWLENRLTFKELLFVLKNAVAVVAPSTGVLHLATCLGARSVGIYSPILAHHPRRWGPRGERASALLPPVDCPATSTCLGPQCVSYNCMMKISSSQVLEELKQ